MVNNKALLFIALATILSFMVFSGYQYVAVDNILIDKGDQRICIPEGMQFEELLEEMDKSGVVHEPISFAFLSKLMNYQDNIKPGCYLLKENMTNPEAIRLLRSGNQEEVKLTFSNARFIQDLAGDLTRNTLADSSKMASLLLNPATAQKYGFNSATFISMFIPNTYFVYWTDDEEAILNRIKKEYTRFWNEERSAKAKKLNLSKTEISTLASIVQGETLSRQEQPKVAGLYLNRVRKGMKLQADPTLSFILGDFTIELRNIHKKIDSPYNTYMYAKIPPGPISMPSVSAIDAVLNEEKHDFLFMCSKGDGSELHNFAKTNAGHIKNIVSYKKNLKKRGK